MDTGSLVDLANLQVCAGEGSLFNDGGPSGKGREIEAKDHKRYREDQRKQEHFGVSESV